MTCASMPKWPSVSTRRCETLPMASGDSPLAWPRRRSSEGSGSDHWRRSAAWKASAAASPPASPEAAWASESCSAGLVIRRRIGLRIRVRDRASGAPVCSGVPSPPKISGAAWAPSMRCGVCVLTAGPYCAAGAVAAGSAGSVTSSSGRARAAALSRRRAPSASACVRAARPAAATPLREVVAQPFSVDPVVSSTPARNRASTSTSTPTRPMYGCSRAHSASPAMPPWALHVGVAEELLGARAAEHAEGIGCRRQHEGGGHEHDAPGDAAARLSVRARHQQVGDEAQQQRQHVGQHAHEPLRHVAQPAAEAAAVPAQVQHEAQEHGQRHAGDGRQLVAVTGRQAGSSGAGGSGARRARRVRVAALAPRRACLGRAVAMASCSTAPRETLGGARRAPPTRARPQTSTTIGMMSGRCRVLRYTNLGQRVLDVVADEPLARDVLLGELAP